MNARFERMAILGLEVFILVSTVAGCIGLLSGALNFPSEWLAGTPFGSYVVPALILGVVVGGSALVAAVMMVREHPLAVPAALGAGLVQIGWIIGEVVLVGTIPGLMLTLQVLYFVAGGLLVILAADLWPRMQRRVI